MYRDDVAAICDIAANPKGFVNVVAFTMATIQMPLQTCLMQCEDIAVNGYNSKYLWGWKKDGYDYAVAYRNTILHKLDTIRHDYYGQDAASQAVAYLSHIPGLGMVKAGFVAQMLGFEAACLDRHNLRKLGLDNKVVKLDAKANDKKRLDKSQEYVRLCNDTGGAEYWWNEWCGFVAGSKYNKRLDTAEKVSKFHVECIAV